MICSRYGNILPSGFKTENNKDFSIIMEWLENELLTFNLQKQYYLPFSCNKTNSPKLKHIHIPDDRNGWMIYPNSEVKYLGAIIDCHMKLDVHINYSTTSAME